MLKVSIKILIRSKDQKMLPTQFTMDNLFNMLAMQLLFFPPIGEPDKELNPKKKIWEQIQPDLYTNDECVATYKGAPFEVKGKGVCRAQTMTNSGIK